MTPLLATTYTICWASFCTAALFLAVRRHARLLLFQRAYWSALSHPWRLTTFAVALAGFIVLAPYTGDPTWDWVDAAFMGVLTFATAPYAVGVIVRCFRGRVEPWQLLPAVALWLLSASWLYDAYIWWRDGFYPRSWWSNLIVSSVLYFAAGAFWSLTVRASRGLTFMFLEPEWIGTVPERLTSRMLWVILLGVLLVAALMLPFLVEAWARLR